MRDALTFIRSVVERELNAATDNPLVFPDTGEVLDESMTETAGLRVDQVKEKLSIASITWGEKSAVAQGMKVHLP